MHNPFKYACCLSRERRGLIIRLSSTGGSVLGFNPVVSLARGSLRASRAKLGCGISQRGKNEGEHSIANPAKIDLQKEQQPYTVFNGMSESPLHSTKQKFLSGTGCFSLGCYNYRSIARVFPKEKYP